MSTIDDQRVWLERIMASPIIGFVVQDGTSGLMQCIDGDPELRMALIEWQTQRIRELECSQRTVPASERDVLHVLTGDQIGDDAAFTELAWQTNNAGTDYQRTPSASAQS